MLSKRRGGGDASLSKRRRVHSEDSASETQQRHCCGGGGDATGLHVPKEEKKPLCVDQVEMGISERMGKGFVLVDSFIKIPERVYFVQSDSKYKEINIDDYFRLQMYYDPPMQGPDRLFIIPRDSSKTSKAKKKSSTLEAVALKIFENLTSYIRYHSRESSWILKENASDTSYDNLWELLPNSAVLVECCRQGVLPKAFRNRMNNSSGKRALCAIFEMASIVAFGPEAHVRAFVTCTTVGSSGKSEKLPVAVTPSDFYHKTGKRRRSKRAQSDHSTDTFEEDIEKASGSDAAEKTDKDATSPSVSINSSRIKIPTTGVYPDLVVWSGCEPNWPHYIFMGELICGRMTTGWEWGEEEECVTDDSVTNRARAQLVREMLAAMLVQNVVFGVVMNQRGASLYSMKLNFEERIIGVYFRDYNWVNQDQTFSYNAIRCMFLDIVGAMEDMKSSLKEVCHWSSTGHK